MTSKEKVLWILGEQRSPKETPAPYEPPRETGSESSLDAKESRNTQSSKKKPDQNAIRMHCPLSLVRHQELVDVNPLEEAHMAEANPVLRKPVLGDQEQL